MEIDWVKSQRGNDFPGDIYELKLKANKDDEFRTVAILRRRSELYSEGFILSSIPVLGVDFEQIPTKSINEARAMVEQMMLSHYKNKLEIAESNLSGFRKALEKQDRDLKVSIVKELDFLAESHGVPKDSITDNDYQSAYDIYMKSTMEDAVKEVFENIRTREEEEREGIL